MRPVARFTSGLAMACAVAACASSAVEVRTMTAPEASFTAFRTFRMLEGPARRDGRPLTGADDPMVNNSIANRAIRERLVRALEARGYARADSAADIAIAFYASTKEGFDISVWDYGYLYPRRWPYAGVQRITEVTQGTVVVDVIDGRSQELLWRGQGTIRLSDDPVENVEELAKAAAAIVKRYPRAARAP